MLTRAKRRGERGSGIISLARRPAAKPLVGHGSGLQTERLRAALAELSCGSSASLSNVLNPDTTYSFTRQRFGLRSLNTHGGGAEVLEEVSTKKKKKEKKRGHV